MSILFFLLSVATAAAPGSASDDDTSRNIRVGLVRSFGGHRALYLHPGPGGVVITGAGPSRNATGTIRFFVSDTGRVGADLDGEPLAADGARWAIRPRLHGEALGLSVAEPGESGAPPRSRLSARGRPPHSFVARASGIVHYRGAVEVSADGVGALRVVNVVPLEEYTRGVVRLEIGADAPAEAQKAQAVAARTFAMKSRGRYAKKGFDVTDTTASQVYGGVEAECDATDRAVADTRGLALLYKGKLVLADYYDDCGGVTAPGGDESDYPPSVVDRAVEGAPEFCAGGRSHLWTLTLSAEEASRVARAMAGQSWEGAGVDIRVDSVDASGRANTIRFVSDTGISKAVRSTALRATIGYERLKSTLFTVRNGEDGAHVFEGRGYGHGRGMCQQGAIGMARQGYGFRDILLHYFPGAAVTPGDGDGRTSPSQ